MDNSNSTTETSQLQALSDFRSTLSVNEDLSYGVAMIIVGVTATGLNVIVLVVSYKHRSLIKPVEYLLLHQAALNIIMVLGMYPLSVTSLCMHIWFSGDVGCRYYAFVGMYIGMADIANLTALSILRYMKICHPLHAYQDINVRCIQVSLALIHIFALLISLAPLLGWGSYGLESHGTSCSVDWHQHPSMSYITTLFVIGFALPLMIMAYCYIAIYCHIKAGSVKVFRKELHLIKMVSKMISGFLVAWSPYAAVTIYAVYCDPNAITASLSAMPTFFAKLINVLNPSIYFFCVPKFRHRTWVVITAMIRHQVEQLPDEREEDRPRGAAIRLEARDCRTDFDGLSCGNIYQESNVSETVLNRTPETTGPSY